MSTFYLNNNSLLSKIENSSTKPSKPIFSQEYPSASHTVPTGFDWELPRIKQLFLITGYSETREYIEQQKQKESKQNKLASSTIQYYDYQPTIYLQAEADTELNWKEASSNKKTYSELVNVRYEINTEKEEIELDYSDMESLAHVELRTGVNWKEASSNTKTYSEFVNIQYDLAIEEEV